ncbi:MAG: 4-(cytidine 5'-diphospho)-2-C-methyl-D-erythritol kinase [Mariprofundaceae bacterium]|nr:4-(cytidine 5'-diphospho)-2-C-methyl-D-erythritol kinase [Mariprofundaceae bacterium]
MTFVLPVSGKLCAPAKINLHLKVTGLLADGRHSLDTSFAFVDAYDFLYIKPSKGIISVTCSIASLSNEKNLVFQILKAFKEQYHVQQGMHVLIEKNLPAEAGLGGGSSDAASALLAANEIWGINLSKQGLIDFASPFGADIPCFLFGQASLATGTGEQLLAYPEAMPSQYICLAKPFQGLSTQKVFQYFDSHLIAWDAAASKSVDIMKAATEIPTKKLGAQIPLTQNQGADTLRAASQGKALIGENALQESAIALLPEINLLLDAMRKKSDMVWMSGSGSSCIALCSDLNQATLLARSLQQAGLASWTHAGLLLHKHPAFIKNIGA